MKFFMSVEPGQGKKLLDSGKDPDLYLDTKIKKREIQIFGSAPKCRSAVYKCFIVGQVYMRHQSVVVDHFVYHRMLSLK